MDKVVFRTPGHIDTRSFTTFGINSKPNTDNPIGFFGTGLKYAIAILLRLNARVQLFIGETEYEFYTSEQEFRTKTFKMVRMRKRKGLMSRWTYAELPFTTETGKTWEAWMALRELESNTRDENGISFVTSNEDIYIDPACTTFVISSDIFVTAYETLHDIFFDPTGLEVRFNNYAVTAYNRPSKYLYYRGLRVMELEKPSIYTYNITGSLPLTEDRTVKYSFYVDSYLTEAVSAITYEAMLEAIFDADEKSHLEPGLPFDTDTHQKSQEFISVVARRKKAGSKVPARVLSYYGSYISARAPKEVLVTVEMPLGMYLGVKELLNDILESDGAYNPADSWIKTDELRKTGKEFLALLQRADIPIHPAPGTPSDDLGIPF